MVGDLPIVNKLCPNASLASHCRSAFSLSQLGLLRYSGLPEASGSTRNVAVVAADFGLAGWKLVSFQDFRRTSLVDQAASVTSSAY